MADQGSVAPKERVNIVYKSATGDKSEDVELPLKLLVVGDYTGRPNDAVVEELEPKTINKDNFDEVLKSFNVSVDLAVPNKLEADSDEEMTASLKFQTMRDFSPDNIARQVPELAKLLELRTALQALKGPLGNVPAFRKTIQGILSDEASRGRLMKELGVGGE